MLREPWEASLVEGAASPVEAEVAAQRPTLLLVEGATSPVEGEAAARHPILLLAEAVVAQRPT